jgi:hypothetical protein
MAGINMTTPFGMHGQETDEEKIITQAENWHALAMERYDEALSLRRRGNEASFNELAYDAFNLEAKAACEYGSLNSAIEPGRTILFKGAAVIASELKRHEDVIHMAGAGLSRCTDSQLRQDLMRLLKQANFELEIFERDGVTLSKSNLRFSIDGSAVGDGFAREDVFRSYLDPIVTMVKRTWQRLQGIDFNEKTGKDRCPIYIAPAYGSLAIELHLGEISQPMLPGFDRYTVVDASDVVQGIVRGLDAVQKDDRAELELLIEDDVYRSNFLELSRKLFPNGDDVNVVKLVANTPRSESVTLTRRIVRQNRRAPRVKREPRIVEVVGQLLLANGLTSGSEAVGILTDEGKTYSVKVPTHMMDDIVRPLWHKRVVASVQVMPKGRGESRTLVHCDEAADD